MELATLVFRLQDQLVGYRAHTSCTEAHVMGLCAIGRRGAFQFHDPARRQDGNSHLHRIYT